MNQSGSCRQMFSNGLNYIFLLIELQIRKSLPSEVQNRPPAFEINVPKEMFTGLFYKTQPMLLLLRVNCLQVPLKVTKYFFFRKKKKHLHLHCIPKATVVILCLILVNSL